VLLLDTSKTEDTNEILKHAPSMVIRCYQEGGSSPC